MAPRKRKKQNVDLPENVYPNDIKGTIYFYYEHPITHDREQLGTDKNSAIRTGTAINRALRQNGIDSSVRAPIVVGMSVSQLVAEYRPQAIKKLGSANSKKALGNYLERIESLYGTLQISRVNVKALSAPIHDLPDNSYIKLRTELVKLFDYALARGHMPHNLNNPAKVLERRIEPKVKRQRLTLDDYRRIYKHENTPEFLRVAMDLMLRLTTRPVDVVQLKFAQVVDGILYTNIRKTDVLQAISLSSGELEVIQRARQSGIASPYIVHAIPGRLLDSRLRSREKSHPTQLTLDKLSNTFSAVRDSLGIGAGKKGTPPTLYEIRSLSARMYEDQGRDKLSIQALLAQLDQKSTGIYINPRDTQKIIAAEAGLRVDMS